MSDPSGGGIALRWGASSSSVGAIACGTLSAGESEGFQTNGMTARAIRFQSAPSGEIGRQFGEKFATAVAELAPGQWQGQIGRAHV